MKISPQKWIWKRPGILLPVFFLSLFPAIAAGQLFVQEASVAALGGAFVARSGFMAAGHNQAGLAWIEDHSITLQHSRPFLELGVSVFACQLKDHKGGWGLVFSTFGITGLRQSSLWLSYGKKLSPLISVGLGMQFQTFSIPEKGIYQPGLNFALGLQARINKKWVLGAHVATISLKHSMYISLGCAFSFFETATCFSELHFKAGHGIQLANGIEWPMGSKLTFMLGINTLPFTWSTGLAILKRSWILQLSFQYVTGNGVFPYTSLHHVW